MTTEEKRQAVKAEIEDKRLTQCFKKTFDLVQRIECKANSTGSISIPVNNAGDFLQLGYNIRYTENSTVTPDGGSPQPFSALKIRMRSQSANNTQSNDYIPVQLISTPGSDKNPRYGTRPFSYVYPKGDALIIEWSNLEPDALNGETYSMANEVIDIVINGVLYTVD